MRVFFDTSGLIKRYLFEKGSNEIDQIFQDAEKIYVAPVSLLESISTIRRLLHEKLISQKEYIDLKKIISAEFEDYCIIPFNNELEKVTITLIDIYQLKTLDAIQLGAAMTIKNNVQFFITADRKLEQAAISEKFTIFNPLEENKR